MTVRDLIYGALKLLGVLGQGQTPSAQDLSDAFVILNLMLDEWSTENLIIFGKTSQTFTFISGQQVYTMGPSGNFNTARPIRIENALCQIPGSGAQSTIELPIRILNQDEWAVIFVKGTQSSIPTRLFVQDTYPLATLNFWPEPNVANNVVLWTWSPLLQFSSVNSTVALPPGYANAIKYSLCLKLAPDYGRTPDPLIVAEAKSTRGKIKRVNIKPQYLRVDDAILSEGAKGFNWITGESK